MVPVPFIRNTTTTRPYKVRINIILLFRNTQPYLNESGNHRKISHNAHDRGSSNNFKDRIGHTSMSRLSADYAELTSQGCKVELARWRRPWPIFRAVSRVTLEYFALFQAIRFIRDHFIYSRYRLLFFLPATRGAFVGLLNKHCRVIKYGLMVLLPKFLKHSNAFRAESICRC